MVMLSYSHSQWLMKRCNAAANEKHPYGIAGRGVYIAFVQEVGIMSKIGIAIKNIGKVTKQLNSKNEASEKVMNAMYKDAKKRVPGWVSTEVTKQYGVKKSEITNGEVGKLNIKGNTYKDLKFVYTGRRLTPTHFSMAPKVPKAGGGYTLKATILKGQRTTLGKVKKLTKKQRKALGKNFTRSGSKRSDHSPIMLMRANGGQYLPFQRKSKRRKDIETIKTVSLPQMVSSDRTAKRIQKSMQENLQKRMDHYNQMYMTKK